jgi:hypothetical protein
MIEKSYATLSQQLVEFQRATSCPVLPVGGPENGQKPRSQILILESPHKDKFSRVKFGFEPLNPVRPPKMGKIPVEFEFGSLHKR